MTNISKHFNSCSEYAEWFASARANTSDYTRYSGFGMGDQHTQGARGLQILREGNEQHVERANAMLEKFQDTLEVPSTTWQLNVAGAFPSVGAYLANDPCNMWSREPDYSDRTPLRVWVGLGTSAMISDEQIITRGCTLAAFALAMSNVRPVIITPYVELGEMSFSRRNQRGMLISWDIQTSPLIISELMGCMAHSEVTRYVGIEACQRLYGPEAAHDGGWHPDAFNEEKMRAHLGCDPADLFLFGLHSTDRTIDDPLAWLSEMITRYSDPDHERDTTLIEDPNGLNW